MLTPLNKGVERNIVNSIIKASTTDIARLSKQAYDWLMIKYGFSTHFNKGGFIAYYGFPRELAADVLFHERENTSAIIRDTNPEAEYERQKVRMYKAVCDGIRKATT